ncbi:MAG: sigma 54-interacting transcriptional regulator, partial [Deltaproteobacteria bacterium]
MSGSRADAEESAAGFEGLVSASPRMQRLFTDTVAVAETDEPVLIQAETGSGKELLARAVHRRSSRALGPYVVVNCGALSPQLLEAELFGSEKGAFTGADVARPGLLVTADGGTLFLDEVGEMPLELQAKLLRVIEQGEVKPVGAARAFKVDVRFVAATNRDLSAESRLGRFREDLLFRLDVHRLEIPPLRQRPEDVPLLWDHFARARTRQELLPKLTPAALAKLVAHRWPGNVRELLTVVKRELCRTTSAPLAPDDLRLTPGVGALPALASALLMEGLTL